MKVVSIRDVFIDEKCVRDGLRPLIKHVTEIINIVWQVGVLEN